jgi:cell division protein FtsQ
LFLAASLFLIGYIYFLRGQQKISAVKINIFRGTEEGFLNKEKITLELKEKSSFDIKQLRNLSISQLESMLKQNPFVEKADVILNIHSELIINILEKKPIVRVFNQNSESFYIDDKARLFPLSPDYSPKLVIASGNINCSYLENAITPDKIEPIQKELCELGKILSNNEFINAQVAQIFINEKGKIELIPLLGNHIILFGNIENAEEKIENLEIFYKDILIKKGWDTYASINLEFKNQVVCIK